jgi:hypothetical protein
MISYQETTSAIRFLLHPDVDVDGCHQKIGESTLADAIVDRIVHDSYTIVIGGDDSMRKIKGLKTES